MEIQNKEKEYKTNATTVYSCQYHVVFCPKYRRSVLCDGIDDRLKELTIKFCSQNSMRVMDMEVMPDHVHLLLDIPPMKSPRNQVTALKGYLSHELRQEFPNLRSRLPSLWTRSIFISSVGAVSLEIVKKYIENQKNK